MSRTFVGNNVKFYMQVDDKLLDVSGQVKSMNITYPIEDYSLIDENTKTYLPGLSNVSIEMVGLSTWSLIGDFIKKIKHPVEWRCDFCGHVNPIKARYCGHKDKHAIGCGARRSFLLDIEND